MKGVFQIFMIFLISVGLYCCSSLQNGEVEYCKHVHRLQNEHAREMRTAGYSLRTTGGALCSDIEEIFVGFYSNKNPNISEARVDYVNGVERFLHRVNQDKSVRFYLHNYPFNIDHLDYSMSYRDVAVDYSDRGPIVFVFYCKGKIIYNVYDPTRTGMNPLKTVHRESYAEALRIVREAGLLTQ